MAYSTMYYVSSMVLGWKDDVIPQKNTVSLAGNDVFPLQKQIPHLVDMKRKGNATFFLEKVLGSFHPDKVFPLETHVLPFVDMGRNRNAVISLRKSWDTTKPSAKEINRPLS